MEQISQIGKKLYDLNQRRWKLTEKMMNPGKLLTAQYYERYTKCGSPTCKCANGELHGPFNWIYQRRKGEKPISTSCRADKVGEAEVFSSNYKSFKENWNGIKEIDEEISQLIDQIEKLYEVPAVEFVKKKGENRGRKQKES
ncbi:MAG: hypothetical protein PHY91_10145 [Tissierellia bacterium]|nr:hypothetical protein [Tissierellia bacterium]